MRDLANWKGCPAPRPVTLDGRYVQIVPYEPTAHRDALWHAFGGLAINERLKYFAQDDFEGIADFDAWLTSVQKSGWITEVFCEKAGGAIVGLANYMRPDPANGVVEIGGVAHSFSMARSPLSTEVHYLMARHAFEDLGYRRYEWKCNNDNMASKKTAERLGFTFEGVFRQHMISKRANRDTAWFSIIDSEWPLLSAAFDAWLSPDNFQADGAQKQKLEDIRARLAAKETA